MKSRNLPEHCLICLITEGKSTPQNFTEKKTEILNTIRLAVEAKISLIQIREKNIPARMVFDLASCAVKIAVNTATRILVNDRADVAFAAGADGVHLTAESIPPDVVRANFPGDFIIGVSAHSLQKAGLAKDQGADFATLSPIFQSPNKGKPLGLIALREVCAKLSPFPVLALGGVDGSNCGHVLENGAAGYAAIRFLNSNLLSRTWKS